MIILFLSSLLWASEIKCPHGSDRFNCVEFNRALDGDTIEVDLPHVHSYFGSKTQVRVFGIDAPESGKKAKDQCEQKLSRIATRFVESTLKNAKRIDLQLIANTKGKMRKEKYGRMLARVIYDKKDLGQVMLDSHFAVPYDGKKKKEIDWCQVGARYLK